MQRLGIYHPLQSFYREKLFVAKQKKYKKQYERFKGRGYTCNVCGAMYERFVPDEPEKENRDAINRNHVIAGFGENVFCPNCLSTARERLVIAVLKEMNMSDKTILHLSPEKNIYQLLQQRNKVVTADLVPGFYKSIDTNIQQQDATRLQFADAGFDLVIANHIMEHIPADSIAMREIYRVLKPASMAILQVPYTESLAYTLEDSLINDPKKQSALYGQKDHVRIYALHDYVQRLKDAGFKVEVMGANELEKFNQYAIQPGEKFLMIRK